MGLKSLRNEISADLNAGLDSFEQRLVEAKEQVSSESYKEEDKLYIRGLLLTAVGKFAEVKQPHPIEERSNFFREARELLEQAEEKLRQLHEKEQAAAE